MKAIIQKAGHRFNGCEVMIQHSGINGHPHLDHAYGYSRSSQERRTVAAIIVATAARAEELMQTFDARDLLITA